MISQSHLVMKKFKSDGVCMRVKATACTEMQTKSMLYISNNVQYSLVLQRKMKFP